MYKSLSFTAFDFLKKLLEINPVIRITVGEALAHPFLKFSDLSENVIDDEDGPNISIFMEKNSSIQNKNLTLNIFHSNINKRLKIASKSTSTYHMNESEYQPFSPTEINTHKNASPSCRTLNKSFNNNNDSFQSSMNESMLIVQQPAFQCLKSGGETSEEESFQFTYSNDKFLQNQKNKQELQKNKLQHKKKGQHLIYSGDISDDEIIEQQQQKKSNSYQKTNQRQIEMQPPSKFKK